ncbi:MAG TPA: radical SAM protein [Candidatus Latescibacteria bacterium]|nr:radical SAM protein [Candidatus Latescibacterota bacterium]HOS65732.1 radical SAM protein [Candidatus Latescibacterota bacterium]HPK74731.1 radical SAM protein [Candidatus Latescibacterota bacterium]
MYPAYKTHLFSSELFRRAEEARRFLAPCRVCPRACGVDRLAGKTGVCGIGAKATVASALAHHGEEPGLSGSRGAGTIFFGGCNLRCIFCQNYQISQTTPSPEYEPEEIAATMVRLQGEGCHNIDLVSPSHVAPQVLEAIARGAEQGLSIPILYNSNGYDSLDMLRLFDGVVDIYLPDLKYGDDSTGTWASSVDNYVEHAHAALKEMYRQVGDVEFDNNGVVRRGMIVRILVLPDDLARIYDSLVFLAEEISTRVWLSVMSQYYPTHRAVGHPKLGRSITPKEYETVLEWVDRLGFENFYAQGMDSVEVCRPDFEKDSVFDFGEA